jgi:ribosome-associated protein
MGGRPLLMAGLPNNSTPDTVPPALATPERPLIDVILNCLDDAKAEQTIAVDITGKSSLADHMVVTSGRSQRHVGAVADQLVTALREAGYGKPRIEGLPHCDWVLIDAGDVIVHVFRPEVREFYNIEKMWQADFAADAH